MPELLTCRTPNIARTYDYMTGGKDHYPADRDAADAILADFPEVAQVARANRRFVHRAVRHIAAQGITQYIDIGAGLPAAERLTRVSLPASAARA